MQEELDTFSLDVFIKPWINLENAIQDWLSNQKADSVKDRLDEIKTNKIIDVLDSEVF